MPSPLVAYLPVACLVTASLLPARTFAEEWRSDLSNSSISFSVRHLVINDVRGSFARFAVTLDLEPERDAGVSAVRIRIEPASVDTGHDGRDSHLRGPDFFDVGEHPEIAFEATRIERRGEDLLATGPLRLLGVTREVTIPFTVTQAVRDPWGNDRRGVRATFPLRRRDWGMTWSQTLDGGGLVVGDEVQVTANLEIVRGS
jgi:polyisoprenoid-binding protein YceI